MNVGGAEDQQAPPLPNLAEVMAVQTQLMQTMTNILLHYNQLGEHCRKAPVESLQKKVEGFIKLRSPTFDNSDNPLDIGDWLREI